MWHMRRGQVPASHANVRPLRRLAHPDDDIADKRLYDLSAEGRDAEGIASLETCWAEVCEETVQTPELNEHGGTD